MPRKSNTACVFSNMDLKLHPSEDITIMSHLAHTRIEGQSTFVRNDVQQMQVRRMDNGHPNVKKSYEMNYPTQREKEARQENHSTLPHQKYHHKHMVSISCPLLSLELLQLIHIYCTTPIGRSQPCKKC